MILCLAGAHASIFKSPGEAFFVSFESFYQQTFVATLCLILLHLWIQILTLEITKFKPLGYACKCNNWYELRKSTNL